MKIAPRHLRKKTRAWVNSVLKGWALEEHHAKILLLAAEAFDRATAAREQIDAEGLTIKDRFDQIRSHPLLNVERDSRLAFARLIRELQLDVEGPEEPRVPRFTTPPMLYGKAERQER